MNSYQAMINERKRREMEAEMNRFELEISSRPLYNNMNASGMPPSTVQFIPHQIQRQLPRTQSSQHQMQTYNDSQHQQQNNYISALPSHQPLNGGSNVNYTVTPMAVPSIAHQSSVQNPQSMTNNATNASNANPSTKKQKNISGEKGKKNKKMLRMAGGTIWEDCSLMEWEADDFRIFCGDLGNDVTDDVLTRAFNRFSSFVKAKVIRDKRTNKTKGYGFVSFKDPQDFTRAMKEMNGKYVGSRPIKLRKSMWRERNLDVVRKKLKVKAKLGLV